MAEKSLIDKIIQEAPEELNSTEVRVRISLKFDPRNNLKELGSFLIFLDENSFFDLDWYHFRINGVVAGFCREDKIDEIKKYKKIKNVHYETKK